MGPRRWTLAEANAAGYFTVLQIAQEANCDSSCIWSRLKGGLSKYDTVTLTGGGKCVAYRLKVKRQ